MAITTVSSREFNQNRSRAEKAAEHGPVFITKRGKPSFVLLKIEEYQKIAEQPKSIIELLAMPEGTPAFDFDPPRIRMTPRPVDFD